LFVKKTLYKNTSETQLANASRIGINPQISTSRQGQAFDSRYGSK
jgi:hypothetical protein